MLISDTFKVKKNITSLLNSTDIVSINNQIIVSTNGGIYKIEGDQYVELNQNLITYNISDMNMKKFYNKYCDLIGLENEGVRRLMVPINIIYILLPFITDEDIINLTYFILIEELRLYREIGDVLTIFVYIIFSIIECGLIVKSLTWIIDGFKKERPPSSQP